MLTLLKFLMALSTFIFSRLSEAKQRKVAEDAIIKSSLERLLRMAADAKGIDVASEGLTSDDIDRILRDQYRD